VITLVVVENTDRWPFHLPGVEVVPARSYLIEPRYADLRRAAVFNVCRHYSYQRLGYYVSLLAAARGHRPLPSVETIQALRISPLTRIASEDLDHLIQRSCAALKSDRFELSIYFGRNVAKRHNPLAEALFNLFPAPFLRATFLRDGRWKMQNIRAIATHDIPDTHRDFVMERATAFFARPRRRPKRRQYQYDLAILRNPQEEDSPSNDRAIRKFIRAAHSVGMEATIVGPDDYGRIAEFDALFIRETTYVNNHTYRMAQRAEAEGLIVIDDPQSIVRCTNKVYQAELFDRYDIPSPRTLVVHDGNASCIPQMVGLPCVLKRPDSSFSLGVVRVDDEQELAPRLAEFFESSELIVAQEFLPSTFDWRIGVLNGEPLYASKYHMARGHWQIIARGPTQARYGRVETIPIEEAPSAAVSIAVRAASLIGQGLYGVDIKQVNGRFVIMEVNDNPSIDAGAEDQILKDDLYIRIMKYFRDRLDARGTGAAMPGGAA